MIAVDEVLAELEWALRNWPKFNSAHEGYAVLAEEMDELWDIVKTNPRKNNERKAQLRREACQVAAMAIRLMHECT